MTLVYTLKKYANQDTEVVHGSKNPLCSFFVLELRQKPSAQRVTSLVLLDCFSSSQLSLQQSHTTHGSESGSFVYHDVSDIRAHRFA